MLVNLCGGSLHFSPLENPQNIIDLGTGTGIWAIDSRPIFSMKINPGANESLKSGRSISERLNIRRRRESNPATMGPTQCQVHRRRRRKPVDLSQKSL